MERVENHPTEPSADDFRDDVHNPANNRDAASRHQANRNERVKARAGEHEYGDENCNDCESVSRDVCDTHHRNREDE